MNNFSDGTISVKLAESLTGVPESSSTSNRTATCWRSATTIPRTTPPYGNSTTASGGRSDSAIVPNRSRWTAAHGTNFKAWLDESLALEYTPGTEPAAAKGVPNPDLSPANNPVLRPPAAGKIGLRSKTDSTSYFEDFLVMPKK